MTALEIAKSLIDILAPGCERVEIAGSLRRGKTNPKDIEIVAIPSITERPIRDMFGVEYDSESFNHLEAVLYTACLGDWAYDLTVKRNGPRYKRLRHASGIACDLFIADVRRWGAIYAIRTGPGEFSQTLVTRAHKLGMFVDGGLLHHHRRAYRETGDGHATIPLPCEKGEACPLVIPTLTEEAFFSALGVRWIAPELRPG